MRHDNYFKSVASTSSRTEGAKRTTVEWATFPFDSSKPGSAVDALMAALAAFDGRGSVSVWRRTPSVPADVPEVGEMPAEAPPEGVDGVLDFAGVGLMAVGA